MIFLLGACLLAGGPASAGTITGRVIDQQSGQPLSGVSIAVRSGPTVTDAAGRFSLEAVPGDTLRFSYVGYDTKIIVVGKHTHRIIVRMHQQQGFLETVVVGYDVALAGKAKGISVFSRAPAPEPAVAWNTEAYDPIAENRFLSPLRHPYSTFSVDVDAASYANLRRFINQGQLPPKDAVRIEEMINYFQYPYVQPEGKDPVAIHTEIAGCPWNPRHRLVMVGLQGRTIPAEHLPAANLVFLVDVSGSMMSAGKLPLVRSALKLLVDQLRPRDRVALVAYAGAAGLVLPSTPGDQKIRIKDAIDRLEAGGSTAGGAGIRLAYQTAREHFIAGGNNRIILATDGDFNVGLSSNAAMEELVSEERRSGVYLTVLGFGMGNYKDSKMEILADKGNGNHAYIDNINEARKVFIHEFGGTLFTVAEDVKLQIEFNPRLAAGYRLIGYENRMLQDEDFNNDKKDAGEIGSGQSVTALYEIIPAGEKSAFLEPVDPPRYQQPAKAGGEASELMTVKLRYKVPGGGQSRLLVHQVADHSGPWTAASNDFRFAAAVAEFGMLLRKSPFRQEASYGQAEELAAHALGQDAEGYRRELLTLIKNSALLEGQSLGATRIPPRKDFVMDR